jgi:hypothetical protein
MTWRVSYFLLKRLKIGVTHLYDHQIIYDSRFLESVFRLRADGMTLQNIWELYNIYKAVLQTSKVPGDIAEVGVYKGGSARLICEMKGGRQLHLFDTFTGMPEVGEHDIHKKGSFNDISIESVMRYLKNYKNVFFYKGFFPKTAAALQWGKISFLHIDADLYKTTIDALNFFYPYMNRGGIIICHDYNSMTCPGVKKAFDEFFKSKPEPVIELSCTSQCLITKI